MEGAVISISPEGSGSALLTCNQGYVHWWTAHIRSTWYPPSILSFVTIELKLSILAVLFRKSGLGFGIKIRRHYQSGFKQLVNDEKRALAAAYFPTGYH
jgi:hypothetical protein